MLKGTGRRDAGGGVNTIKSTIDLPGNAHLAVTHWIVGVTDGEHIVGLALLCERGIE